MIQSIYPLNKGENREEEISWQWWSWKNMVEHKYVWNSTSTEQPLSCSAEELLQQEFFSLRSLLESASRSSLEELQSMERKWEHMEDG